MADFDIGFDLSAFDLESVSGSSRATSIFSCNSPVHSPVNGFDENFDETADPPLDLQSYSTPGGFDQVLMGFGGKSSSAAAGSVSKREETGHGFLQTPVDAEPVFEIAEDGSLVERGSAQGRSTSVGGVPFEVGFDAGGVGQDVAGAIPQVSNALTCTVMAETDMLITE
jgi:hypothetical protein